VCPLGVDADVFHPARRERALRKRLGLAKHARLCVFAGRFAPAKNLPVLVDAFRMLGPPYHLLLVGNGPCLPALPRNVTVLPFERDPARLAAIVGGADAFVQAGERESFGLAVVEAMACGVPVVAAADGAAPEIVTPDCGVLVRAGSAADLADGVAALYSDRNAMGVAARARAESHFGWDRVFRRLLRQYASVAPAAAARALREQAA
jgi:alpha-1,6-mannosyltransferase